MDMIGYVVWNPSKEQYLTANMEWTRYVKDAHIFDTNKDTMTAIEALGVRGLRVLEKFIRIDTLTHKIHVSGYEWLTKHVDPAMIQKLGGVVNGGKRMVAYFPSLRFATMKMTHTSPCRARIRTNSKNIIKEKLNNHE